jgi:hypothetical protein
MDIKGGKDAPLCFYPSEGDWAVIFLQLDNTLYLYIPFFLIIISNTLIIVGINASKRKMKQAKNVEADSNESRIVLNLLLVSSTYIMFLAPFAVVWTYFATLQSTSPDPAQQRLVYLVGQITDQGVLMNYACNFIIYSCTLPLYKAEFRALFRF